MFQSVMLITLSFMCLNLTIFLFYNSMFLSVELPLISIFSTNIPVSFIMDWYSSMFMFTVLFISSMIMIFSMSYIPMNEQNQFKFMLLMFIGSMIMLIISDNIIFIILGWDGLGLSSYILVVYYQNFSSSASGSITIFSNRIGDVMIMLTISILMMNANWNFNMNEEYPLVIMILLIIAAASKSAQFPFSAWLPAAMAAPTPISALVHSSTLVTAGVYLLIRVMNFTHPISMLILLIISSMTVIYASMSANWEQDMKKIIALSTLSQIAIMLFAISIGMISIAYFHLIIHAMFKSLMFLCAGIMIHNSSYQDMRTMGASKYSHPMMMSILGISSLALMGLPFMSGFFSKDSIIEAMLQTKFMTPISILMIMSIGMTATYSIRLNMLAMKLFMKLKPDNLNSPNNYMETPPMLMAPMSIIMGALMLWMTSPEQIYFMPFFMKVSIIILLIMGILLGASLNYLSKTYLKLGGPSINLWFLHYLSSLSALPAYPLMNLFMKSDKMWQEIYGPKYLMNMTSSHSTLPDKMNLNPLFILLLLFLFPVIFFV